MAKLRRSPQQWHQLVEAQQSSGLSVAQFCTENKITLSNFYLQRKKYRSQSFSNIESAEDWLPLNDLLQVTQDERRWQIELKLPNGVVLNMRSDNAC